MYDPHRDPRQQPYAGAGMGVLSAFVPQGTVGCLLGLFILLLIALVAGMIEGPWLLLTVAALVILVPLIRWAVRKEIRREDRIPPGSPGQAGSLPPDSELSEEERRSAMREYREDPRDNP